MNVNEVWAEGVDWIHLVRDMIQWQALVRTATNFRVP
jgi:hypothetical protein